MTKSADDWASLILTDLEAAGIDLEDERTRTSIRIILEVYDRHFWASFETATREMVVQSERENMERRARRRARGPKLEVISND